MGIMNSLGAMLDYPTNYPASLDRLFPSITSNTSNPAGVIPENGNGLAHLGTPFGPPPFSRYRTAHPSGYPGHTTYGIQGIAEIVDWPPIQTEYDIIMSAITTKNMIDDSSTNQLVQSMSGLFGLGDDASDAAAQQAAAAMYFQQNVTQAVKDINAILPDDSYYQGGAVAAGAQLASYYNQSYPGVSSSPDVVQALKNLQARYLFVQAHYPGVSVLKQGSTMPSGSGARPPILIYYNDDTVGYAPGFGPVSQYGAYQVQSASVPASPRVNVYTGATTGSTVSSSDVGAPLVGSGPAFPGTWDGVGPGPGGVIGPLPTPPPGVTPGVVYTNTPTTSGTPSTGSTGTVNKDLISGVPNNYLMIGAAALIAMLALGRR